MGLLLGCGLPADPAPKACDQPPTDKVMYFLGQYRDFDPVSANDSVFCLNTGWDNAWADVRANQEPANRRTWFTGARMWLNEIEFPGVDFGSEMGINFVFAPSSLPGTSFPSDLQAGRVPWGNARMPGIDNQMPPPRPGVQVWLRRNSKLDQGWYSYAGEQSPDHYFEITELRQDPSDDLSLLVTGRFTARLYGFANASGQRRSILLRNARFRIRLLAPANAYVRVQ